MLGNASVALNESMLEGVWRFIPYLIAEQKLIPSISSSSGMLIEGLQTSVRCGAREEKGFRSSFSPFQGGGCTECFRGGDTRCGTYVIYPAYLQSRCSPS